MKTELIKRQDAIDVVGQSYRYESDRMTALQELPIVTEQEIRNKAIEEFAEKCNQKITVFVLEHKDQLDFASGVSVVWNIIDEIAESMKGGK